MLFYTRRIARIVYYFPNKTRNVCMYVCMFMRFVCAFVCGLLTELDIPRIFFFIFCHEIINTPYNSFMWVLKGVNWVTRLQGILNWLTRPQGILNWETRSQRILNWETQPQGILNWETRLQGILKLGDSGPKES